ncbi:hypothetical protein DTO207G8_356 [Paecilomyces variotii]|nr:hypothetical protein DTO032I3_3855 [Paecilomyces variotii]KAJ9225938.1 hypothetical protein DTO169C6_1577 [Paecilomyces variotii]KAJ9233717.1 hypothetical protein DTO169E5_6922 [Paecilomyces variotii]KAJ9261206.1 hypothetical protein DTO207G8_356 [Paecilomyces variotii]KAJ9266814.1 hypothetical protein DTO195F2_749 [Paecilomyces variotii]
MIVKRNEPHRPGTDPGKILVLPRPCRISVSPISGDRQPYQPQPHFVSQNSSSGSGKGENGCKTHLCSHDQRHKYGIIGTKHNMGIKYMRNGHETDSGDAEVVQWDGEELREDTPNHHRPGGV